MQIQLSDQTARTILLEEDRGWTIKHPDCKSKVIAKLDAFRLYIFKFAKDAKTLHVGIFKMEKKKSCRRMPKH